MQASQFAWETGLPLSPCWGWGWKAGAVGTSMKHELCFVRPDPKQLCGAFAALGAAAAKSHFTPREQTLSYALFHISRNKKRRFYVSSAPYSLCMRDSRAVLASDTSRW